ncbi:TPA: hypoxanthine phosphoribosyltransferase [candidate division WOR-3 bacterium]|jgi:hypoxanthine phosphoribosyltransferase|uniref:Hypoxanthine phosphoribosyltransferase n=1 Tax=candidate division WOR-3 bacterium TaxID=2052148 RepID=A0A350H935_UNCW3|nr:hypoxanthine phosphoribosyltransferase [candidate division WOR-3 bacterium]
MSEKIEVYIKHDEIMSAIDDMAIKLNEEYKDKFPVFIVILKGAFMFASELVKRMNTPLNIDFMVISSYGSSTTSSGNVRIEEDIKINIENRHVIIIEDIIDTGQTIEKVKQKLSVNNPLSLKLVSLLDKPSRRIVKENPDYSCFQIEDKFVVGFGLDYNQMYRNLPYIGILTEVK